VKKTPALVALSLLAACSSTPQIVVEPIEPEASLPVEYVAHLSSEALPHFEEEDFGIELVDVTDDVRDPYGQLTERPEEGELDELVEVGCLVVQLPRESARQMLSRCESRLGANLIERSVAEERFEALREHPRVDTMHCPRLSLYHGQRGNLTTSNQVAYIDSFKLEVSGDGEVFIADPVIGVARDGISMDLVIGDREAGEAIPVDLVLHTSELQKPMIETEGRLPGTATPVTVQLPLFATQRLHVAADLSAEQALVIGAVPGVGPDLVQLFLVTVDFHQIFDHDEVVEPDLLEVGFCAPR